MARCELCNKSRMYIWLQEDPYAAEVNDDHTLCVICDDCAELQSLEV